MMAMRWGFDPGTLREHPQRAIGINEIPHDTVIRRVRRDTWQATARKAVEEECRNANAVQFLRPPVHASVNPARGMRQDHRR